MRAATSYKQSTSTTPYILSSNSPLVAAEIAGSKKVEQFADFKERAGQAAHDIGTPLATLSMALKHRFKELSKEEYTLLSNLINKIRKIAQVFLDHPAIANPIIEEETSNEKTSHCDNSSEDNERKKGISSNHQHILVSQALAEVIEQKKLMYYGKHVKFGYSFDPLLRFTFIRGNALNFERMMCNLMKNSVEAFEGKNGIVNVGFSLDGDNIKITVEDNGKGMSPETVEKLNKGEPVSTTKIDGNGIGTQQIRDTLAEFGGTQVIKSMLDVGTKITLTIPKFHSPKWVIEKVYLHKGDIVVILDDDISIHQKWKEKLERYTPKISLNFFTNAQETIDFINSHKHKDDIRLLTDYELRGQELNGLDVVQKCGLEKYRASLISGAYSHKEIQDKAAELNVAVLPKALLDIVPIVLDGRIDHDMAFSNADVIMIDDDGSLSNSIRELLEANGLVVDNYYDPRNLVENLSKYDVNTKIITDNCFDGGMSGDALVQTLWKKGFRNICVFSGYERRDVGSKYPICIDFVTKGEGDIDMLIYWCKSS